MMADEYTMKNSFACNRNRTEYKHLPDMYEHISEITPNFVDFIGVEDEW